MVSGSKGREYNSNYDYSGPILWDGPGIFWSKGPTCALHVHPNPPVEEKVVYPSIYQDVQYPRWLFGISEPSTVILPKTKISPENWWLEDVFPIEIVPFWGTC